MLGIQMLTSCIYATGVSSQFWLPDSSFLLMLILGDGKWWLKWFGSFHLSRKMEFLQLGLCSDSVHIYRVNQQVRGLFLFPSGKWTQLLKNRVVLLLTELSSATWASHRWFFSKHLLIQTSYYVYVHVLLPLFLFFKHRVYASSVYVL